MDIKHLRYFVAIVENDFNLSRTARSLYISQPTLSVMINNFEEKEGVKLFHRQKNKLLGLTLAGKNFYQDARELIKQYYRMQYNLHSETKNITGSIKIGCPSLIFPAVFSKILPELMLQYPNVHFDIQEHNATQLKQALLSETLDLTVLLHPVGISRKLIDAYQIQDSELVAILPLTHPLVNKPLLEWSDLQSEKIAIFDYNHMNYQLVKTRLEQERLLQNLTLEAGSWEFLVNSVRMNHELIAFIPHPMAELYAINDLAIKKINKPIPWKVMLCSLKKSHYHPLEQLILDQLLANFL